jgi:hypothetical protein
MVIHLYFYFNYFKIFNFLLILILDIRKKYNFMKIIGTGSFGVVRLASDKTNPFIKYAIKSISKDTLN